MTVALHEILALVGPLDDDGFESSSRRFRQYLTERVTDIHLARSLIEQCHQVPGQIERRALQDLIVLLGRFLGFEVVYGAYEPLVGILEYHGHWHSPQHRDVVIEVRSDRTTSADLRSISRAVAALTDTALRGEAADPTDAAPPTGLLVATPLYGRRARLEQAVHERKTGETLRLISSDSLVLLAEQVSTGRLTHDDVLRLLESSLVLDALVDLLRRSPSSAGIDRCTVPVRSGAQEQQNSGNSVSPVPRSRHWFATMLSQGELSAGTVAELVARRQVFRLTGQAARSPIQALDWVCFCVPGKGVVGHAQVESVADSLLHLQNIDLYPDSPTVPGFQTQLRVTAAYTAVEPDALTCLAISEREFIELTRPAAGNGPVN